MNSQTITMEREAAIQKLSQYEEAAKKNPKLIQELDRGIMQGYKILAKGGRVIEVNHAIAKGGLNLAGIPKLAIARAHVEATRFSASKDYQWINRQYTGTPNGGCVFDWSPVRTRLSDDRVKWLVTPGTFPADKINTQREFQAMTPLVPLPLRPRHALDNYFLLWEANWHPAPPRDPYLLRQLAGPLMEIIAEWELTELEIAAVSSATRNG